MTWKLENGPPKNNQNHRVRIPETPNLRGETVIRNGMIDDDPDTIVLDSQDRQTVIVETGEIIEMVKYFTINWCFLILVKNLSVQKMTQSISWIVFLIYLTYYVYIKGKVHFENFTHCIVQVFWMRLFLKWKGFIMCKALKKIEWKGFGFWMKSFFKKKRFSTSFKTWKRNENRIISINPK